MRIIFCRKLAFMGFEKKKIRLRFISTFEEEEK